MDYFLLKKSETIRKTKINTALVTIFIPKLYFTIYVIILTFCNNLNIYSLFSSKLLIS